MEYKHKNGYDSLTKENFWDEIKEKYPEAFEHFCNWIDNYKQEINSMEIFAAGIKFHDLPFELQNGIIARFDIEKFSGKDSYTIPTYAEQLRNLFKDVQNSMDKRSTKLN